MQLFRPCRSPRAKVERPWLARLLLGCQFLTITNIVTVHAADRGHNYCVQLKFTVTTVLSSSTKHTDRLYYIIFCLEVYVR